nr:MAG TPA: hypothetical protein [Caudoviricetes sp.]
MVIVLVFAQGFISGLAVLYVVWLFKEAYK